MKSLIAAFLEKMPFWKKKMRPQYNVDYVLIDSDDGTKTGVGIQTGEFAGVLYHYGKVRLSEEDDFARMTFSYTIVSSPKIPIDDLIQDKNFHTFIGDILTEILLNQERANEKIGNYDPEEFDI
jgi:hypothetical protein